MAYVLIRFDIELLFKSSDYTIQGLAKFVNFRKKRNVAKFLLRTDQGKCMLKKMLDIEVFDEETAELHCNAEWANKFCTSGRTPEQAFDAIIAHYSPNPRLLWKDMDRCWKKNDGINGMALVRDDEKLFSILVACNEALCDNYPHGVITN